MKHLRKIFSTETKSLADERALMVTISTPTPDRMKDVVVPEGGKLDSYLKNPVVLLFHDYNQLPIAKASELHVTESGIRAKVQFPEEGKSPKADEVYSLYKDGFMNAWSIGFAPNYEKATPIKDGGWRFEEWELLEFSAVPVPANAEALTIMRSKGLEAPESVDEVVLEDDKFAETIVEESKDLDQPEPDVENEAHEEEKAPAEAEEVVIDAEAKTISITTAKGIELITLAEGYRLEVKECAVAEEEPAEPSPEEKFIELTTETLKEVDQIIGRALRDLKQRNQS